MRKKLAAVFVLSVLLSQTALAAPLPTETDDMTEIVSKANEQKCEQRDPNSLPAFYLPDDSDTEPVDGEPVEFVYDPMHQVFPVDALPYAVNRAREVIPFPEDCRTYGEALARWNPDLKALYDTTEQFFEEANRDNWKLEKRTFRYAGATEQTIAYGLICHYGWPKGIDNYQDFQKYIQLVFAAYRNDHPYETIELNNRLVSLVDHDENGQATNNGYEVLFWLSGDENDSEKTKFEKFCSKRQELKEAVDTFVAQFHADQMDTKEIREQYRYIHDKLSRACSYNHPALNWHRGEERYWNAHNAYGTLVGGQGCDKGSVVCQGYTDAFQLLCQQFNLPCVAVYGYTGKDWSGYHIWNDILLDNEWYAIDLTWNDTDNTYNKEFTNKIYVGSVDYSYTNYQYFGDNRYFLEAYTEQYNHQTATQYFLAKNSWIMEAPPLTDTAGDTGWQNEGMSIQDITLKPNTRKGYAPQLSDAFRLLRNGNTIRDIPNAEIIVPDGTEFIRFRITDTENHKGYRMHGEVPEGFCYTVRGENGTASIKRRADDAEPDGYFEVAAGGTLILEDISIDGNGETITLRAPLIQNHGTLHLKNVTIENNHAGDNAGAYAVSCEAGSQTILDGSCFIRNNGNRNLYLAADNLLRTDGLLQGNISVSTAENVSSLAQDVPDNIGTIFHSDQEDIAFLVQDGVLQPCPLVSTDKTMPAWFTYPQQADMALLRGQTLRLSDPDRRVTALFLASYSEAGRMMQIEPCTVSETGTVTLPAGTEEPEGAFRYKLFALDELGRPCSAPLVLLSSPDGRSFP